MLHTPRIQVGQVNMMRCEEARNMFDIRHNPTLILFKDGKMLSRYKGLEEVANVEEWVYKHTDITPEVDE